ncbi:MAG TPA: DUF456 domain-containing protein [Anaerolineaceae bacterium]|nr:DUF456 domain-containing protein [Anaerolineaceae bacterium]
MTWLPEGLYWGLVALSLILQLIGLLGLLLVYFPGLTVMWVGQLIWAIYTQFNLSAGSQTRAWTIGIFVFNTLLMIIGSLIDNVLMVDKTRREGVPWWGIGLSWLAMIGVGLVATPIGGLAAGLLTIFLVQYFHLGRDSQRAFNALKAMMLSSLQATLIRLGFALVMLVGWLTVMFWLPGV